MNSKQTGDNIYRSPGRPTGDDIYRSSGRPTGDNIYRPSGKPTGDDIYRLMSQKRLREGRGYSPTTEGIPPVAGRAMIDVSKFPKGNATGPIPAGGGRISDVGRKRVNPETMNVRTQAASATMGGYSPEAQALMSDRAKTILGGKSIYGGRNVLQQPAPAPRPALPPAGSTAAPAAPTTGTPAPSTAPRPSTSTAGTPAPTAAPAGGLTPEQMKLYQQAYANRNNPFARGRIQGALDKMTPEQRRIAMEYAKSQGQDQEWAKSGYKFEQFINNFRQLNTIQEMNSHLSNFKYWVDDLLTEGYDLSDYSWDDMYDIYLDEGYGLYEYMMDYLISEGYANDAEGALAIMANMSEEWKHNIVEGILSTAGGALMGALRNPTGAAQAVGNVVGTVQRGAGQLQQGLQRGLQQLGSAYNRGRLSANPPAPTGNYVTTAARARQGSLTDRYNLSRYSTNR